MLAQLFQNIRVMRLLLVIAAVLALLLACMPHPPQLPGNPSDKIQHMVAFSVLTVLARAALRELGDLWILAGLCIFGGVIELIQAVPALHRDSSFADWAADCHAAVGTLMAVALIGRILPRS